MPLTATCHCGQVKVVVPRRPRGVTDCNCSICRRYGVLWAYYRAGTVKTLAQRGATDPYAWGRRALRFVRCRNCGCLMWWERVRKDPARKMGVNARCFPRDVVERLPIRKLDGAAWDGTSW